MPGPVSDSYDPEWGTVDREGEISRSLMEVHGLVGQILGSKDSIHVLELMRRRAELHKNLVDSTRLTEWEWRIIRFALERARDSI